MADNSPKCRTCGKDASLHVTEIVDGAAREVHYCAEHAEEDLRDVPIKRAEPWPEDDRHATLEVSAQQLESGDTLVARFPDGVELKLPDYEPAAAWKVIRIAPLDGPSEPPRFLRVRLRPSE